MAVAGFFALSRCARCFSSVKALSVPNFSIACRILLSFDRQCMNSFLLHLSFVGIKVFGIYPTPALTPFSKIKLMFRSRADRQRTNWHWFLTESTAPLAQF